MEVDHLIFVAGVVLFVCMLVCLLGFLFCFVSGRGGGRETN